VKGTDRYGRLIADVILPDGKILNEELLKAGLAWWFRKYSRDERLAQLESAAKEARYGIWADASPIAPWDYRKSKTAEHTIAR
jgi:micrococcal nuclease